MSVKSSESNIFTLLNLHITINAMQSLKKENTKFDVHLFLMTPQNNILWFLQDLIFQNLFLIACNKKGWASF